MKDTQHHTELWQAVIQQAVQDATSPTCNKEDAFIARQWLTTDDGGFDFVCELAGKCPERMRKNVLAYLEQLRTTPKKRHKQPPSKTYTYGGRSLSLKQWAGVTGLSYNVLLYRMKCSTWTVDRALTEPLLKRGFTRSRAPGVPSDLADVPGTGAGSIAHDFPEIEFSEKESTNDHST